MGAVRFAQGHQAARVHLTAQPLPCLRTAMVRPHLLDGSKRGLRCSAYQLASPTTANNLLSQAHQQQQDEVSRLRAQLRDAELEAAMYETQLQDNESHARQLIDKLRKAVMAQANTKMAVQEFQDVLNTAQQLAARERAQLFAERVRTHGREFRNETCRRAFVARQVRGMARLSEYHDYVHQLALTLKTVLPPAEESLVSTLQPVPALLSPQDLSAPST